MNYTGFRKQPQVLNYFQQTTITPIGDQNFTLLDQQQLLQGIKKKKDFIDEKSLKKEISYPALKIRL